MPVKPDGVKTRLALISMFMAVTHMVSLLLGYGMDGIHGVTVHTVMADTIILGDLEDGIDGTTGVGEDLVMDMPVTDGEASATHGFAHQAIMVMVAITEMDMDILVEIMPLTMVEEDITTT